MYPTLYEYDETEFTSNGLGKLSDCTSCLVTEGRNGIYEVEFEYPITGIHYEEIQTGRIITVTHDENGDMQPFEIYRISRPISGIVQVNAHHLSYRLSNIIVSPFSAASMSNAMEQLVSAAVNTNPFTFETDNTTAGTFSFITPSSIRSIMGGVEGSLLDVYGGEWEFDKWNVINHSARGSDNGVTIRYGKNMTGITAEIDTDGLYNAAIPYWTNGEDVVKGGLVIGSGWYGSGNLYNWTDESDTEIEEEGGTILEFRPGVMRIATLDMSEYFEDIPTVSELQTAAANYLANNQPWIPKENIKVDFVALWQTEEYADIAPIEKVKLCDTVTVIYTDLGVQATAKVIKVVWDALLERYDSIELGEAQNSFAQTITNQTEQQVREIVNTITISADRIIGGTLTVGGYNNAYGKITMLDANGNVIGAWDNSMFQFSHGDEWIRFIESVIEGGCANTLDGTLDLSAQYTSDDTRKVVLRAITSDLYLTSNKGRIWAMAEEKIALNSGGDIDLGANGAVNVYYGNELQGLAIGGAANEDEGLPAIKKIYLATNGSTPFVMFECTDGTTYYTNVTKQ